MIPAVPLAAFALLAVGFAAGSWWRGRIDRASPAVVREIREQADRQIVVTLSERAERKRDLDEAKRARLYRPRDTDVEPQRMTDAD